MPNNVLLDAGGIRVVVTSNSASARSAWSEPCITANIPGLFAPLLTADVIVAEASAGNNTCPCPVTP